MRNLILVALFFATSLTLNAKTEETKTVQNFNISCDTWNDLGGNTFKTSGSFSIMYSPGGNSTGLSVKVLNGEISINTDTNIINSASGDVQINFGDGYENVFSGTFTLDGTSGRIKPKRITYSLRGFGPTTIEKKVVLEYIDMNTLKQQLDYPNGILTLNFPGFKAYDDNTFHIYIKSLSIDRKKYADYIINDVSIKFSIFKYYLKNLKVCYDKYDKIYYVVAKSTKLSSTLGNNKFVKFASSTEGSTRNNKFAFTFDKSKIGLVNFKKSDTHFNYPKWGIASTFPDLYIGSVKFVKPYMSFDFDDVKEEWYIDFQSVCQLPIAKGETDNVKLNWLQDDSPYLKSHFILSSKSPYVKLISTSYASGSGFLSFIGIGVPGVWRLNSLYGKYEMKQTSDGDFKSMKLEAGTSMDLGPSWYGISAVTVYGDVDYKKTQTLDRFKVNGKLKAMKRYVNIGSAEVKIASKKTKTRREKYIHAKGYFEFPSDLNDHRLIYGKTELEIQTFKQQRKDGSWYSRLNMNLDGYMNFKIKKGIVKYGSYIKWPKSTKTISTGKIGFGRVVQKNYRYGLTYYKKFTIRIPYIKTYHKTIGLFISLDDKPSFSVRNKKYSIAKIKSSLAKRSIASGKKLSDMGLVSYTFNKKIEEMVIAVKASEDSLVEFSISYQGNVPPSMTMTDPDGTKYNIDNFIIQNPDLIGENGFIVPLPNKAGNWTVTTNNPASIEDYTVEVDLLTNPAIMNISSVSANSGIVSVDCDFSDPKADDVDVDFYWTLGDTINMPFLVDKSFKFSQGKLHADLNATTLIPGTYKLYAIYGDSINLPARVDYEGSFVIDNSFVPQVPSNFRVAQVGDEYLIEWDYPEGTESFNIKITDDSGNVDEQFTVNSNSIRITVPQVVMDFIENGEAWPPVKIDPVLGIPVPVDVPGLPTYHVSVSATGFNGSTSSFSSNFTMDLRTIIPDNTAPILGGGITATKVLNVLEPYAQLNLPVVAGIKGYKLRIRQDKSQDFYEITTEQPQLKIYDFEVGSTYYVSAIAYDYSLNESISTPEIKIDFFNEDDKDLDLMKDDLEVKYFGSIDVTNNPQDDIDGDGLTTAYELATGLNPNDYDTDGDLVWDGDDPNPLQNTDKDNDMMADDWETHFNIDDPNDDPDNDGLINQKEYFYATNPKIADTDNGGVSDGKEVEYGLDPLSTKDDVETPDRIITNIESYSTKYEQENSAEIEWKTKDEDLLTGFNIYRRFSELDDWEMINNDLIVRPDDAETSHNYTFTDSNTKSISVIYYKVMSISEGGSQEDAFEKRTVQDTNLSNNEILESNKMQLHNFPNPFTSSTTISFYIPKKYQQEEVNITIYTINGVLVDKFTKYTKGGIYNINWKPENLNTGIYVCKVTTNKMEQIIKLVMK